MQINHSDADKEAEGSILTFDLSQEDRTTGT